MEVKVSEDLDEFIALVSQVPPHEDISKTVEELFKSSGGDIATIEGYLKGVYGEGSVVTTVYDGANSVYNFTIEW